MAMYIFWIMLHAVCGGVVVETYIFTPAFEGQLRSFVDTTMECRHIPGLTLSVVKDSETWAEGFGITDIVNDNPVSNSSLFNIGSITKSFTMALIGTFLSENGMNWTARVIDILGPDYTFNDQYRTHEMTLRDLLSHRSGLANIDLGLLARVPTSLTRAESSRRMRFIPEAKPFRDSFLYNNYMYMVLGHVAEKLGKDSWENLVTSRLFKPLGMRSSTFIKMPSDVMEDNVAKPYIYKDGRFQNGTLDIYSLHPYEPAGAILSTGEDMSKWMRFLLKSGKTDTGTILVDEKLMKEASKAKSYDESLQKRSLTRPEFPVSDTQIGYGYALFASSYRGYERVWHSGGLFSYISLFWIFPERQIGIFASVNGPGFKSFSIQALNTILYYVGDHLLDETPWLNETTTCTYPQPWSNITNTNSTTKEISVELPNVSDYAGLYGNHYLPDMNISVDKTYSNKLFVRMNRLSGELFSTTDKDRFLFEITQPWEFMTSFTDGNNETIQSNVTFIREKGDIKFLHMSLGVNVVYTKGVSILDPIVSGSNKKIGLMLSVAMLSFMCMYLLD